VLRRSGKNRLEGRKIRMNVGDHKCAHVSFSFVFWLCAVGSEQAVILFLRL
jgi:hypothetical protein